MHMQYTSMTKLRTIGTTFLLFLALLAFLVSLPVFAVEKQPAANNQPVITVPESPALAPPPKTNAKSWTIRDMMNIASVTQVTPSPDGKKVAFAVVRPVMSKKKSEFVSQIFVSDVDGKNAVQVTRMGGDNPKWSPDGRILAFQSKRSGKSNVFMLPLSGGESFRVTNSETGVDNFSWSADGKFIAFTQSDPKTRNEIEREEDKNDPIVAGTGHKMNRIWVQPVNLTPGKMEKARMLTKGVVSVVTWDWSPDGRTIVFEHSNRPAHHDEYISDVSKVDVATGKITPLFTGRKNHTVPMFSPDGKWISVVESEDPPEDFDKLTILLIPAKGEAKPIALGNTFNEQPRPLGWTKDSKHIIAFDFLRSTSALYAIPVDGKPAKQISTFKTGFINGDDLGMNSTGTMVGFTWQDPTTPPEAFVSRVDSFKPVKITSVNEWAKEIPTAKSEVIRWKSKDGAEVEGILTYPLNYQPGKKYPFLLLVHGGPAWYSPQAYIVGTDGIPLRYPVPVFATQGYAILKTNYRGSTGYGTAFRKANIGGWGTVDYQDVMAGVDHVINMGVADPDRMGIMGWSYGGYMTSWTISQTNRFKAASVGAGVIDLISMTFTTDTPLFSQHYFGMNEWNNPELYLSRSSIGHVQNITTPTLIQHGMNDIRVPYSQGVELYNALKLRNVPVMMVSYPRQPHSVREPKLMMDVLKRNLDWFNKYIPVK